MKKLRYTTRIISLFFAASVLFASCVSTTMIQSKPTGAKIYIDGQPVGTTPYSYSDTKIVGSMTSVKLEKEGYEPMNITFSRSEQADVGAIIGGLFVWVPFLWAMKYNPTHTYELSPVKENAQQTINTQSPVYVKSKGESLCELKQLLDDKIITQEEYEIEKKKILEKE